MFVNKTKTGKNNICGEKIKKYRQRFLPKKISQRELADRLCLIGLDIDKNVIQRIESGKRFITDIELKYIAQVLNVSLKDLLDGDDENDNDVDNVDDIDVGTIDKE